MITIHVSPARGIIVTGTAPEHRKLLGSRKRGGLGLRWSNHIEYDGRLGAWFEPDSRDRHLSEHRDRMEQISATLRAAGLPVTIDVTDEVRSAEQIEAEMYERAAIRARIYRRRAAEAGARAERHRTQAATATRGYPPDQPILLGSSRQRAYERVIERNHSHTRKAIEETDRHQYWITRSRTVEHLKQHRRDPRATLRRIERLREQLRRIERILTGEAHPQFVERDGEVVLTDNGNPVLEWQPATGDYRERLLLHQVQLSNKIAYWQDVVAQAAAEGVKIWGPADFRVGDFVLYLGTWYEVLRVNTKSLTVPTGHHEVGRRILRQSHNVDRAGQPSETTGRLPYAEVQGRMSSAEAATKFPPEPGY
ncbi:hypothetical protein GCM10009733_103530 [Nonomuraea maheshkhaliensis]|uniref:DUF3560 domain-containing protein n=1 Tax=Nonomuraea maheshkhaliensis TaxID=419590 RepID=A0ABN2HN45_9ACTN